MNLQAAGRLLLAGLCLLQSGRIIVGAVTKVRLVATLLCFLCPRPPTLLTCLPPLLPTPLLQPPHAGAHGAPDIPAHSRVGDPHRAADTATHKTAHEQALGPADAATDKPPLTAAHVAAHGPAHKTTNGQTQQTAQQAAHGPAQ